MNKKLKLPIVLLMSCLMATNLSSCGTTTSEASSVVASDTTSVEDTSVEDVTSIVEATSEVTSVEEVTSEIVVKTGTVAVVANDNGMIVPDITSGEVGDTVTVTVTANTGFTTAKVFANAVELTEVDGKYSFVLIEGENTVSAEFVADVVLTLNTEAVEINELGTTTDVVATMSGSEEKIVWSTIDDTVVSLAVSEDSKTCTITNLRGGSTVVVATLGSLEKMVTVKCSSYGDVRAEYSCFMADGTKIGDYKGFFNAIEMIHSGDYAETAGDGTYITTKSDTDTKVYVRDEGYAYNYLTKEGTYHGLDANDSITDGKSNWFGSYQTAIKIDDQKEFSMFQSAGGSIGQFLTRPTNFDGSMFSDGYTGYSNLGNPGTNIWSGWRSALYAASITSVEYVTWADPYNWNEMDLTFDLSESVLTPSYNANQGTFAQIYLGTAYRMQNLYGVYFDAGTMESCASLVDGATRNIYTFEDKLVQVGGLSSQAFSPDRAVGTTPIGEASWDAFNHTWTFPEVNVELNVFISYTGENAEALEANYIRNYEISGYKGTEKVDSVEYVADFGGAQTREGASERSIYGVSLTPEWVGHAIADITNGSSWTNVVQTTSLAYNLDGTDQSLQFTAGRTVNGGNQTGIYGSDSCVASTNKDDQSVFDFKY